MWSEAVLGAWGSQKAWPLVTPLQKQSRPRPQHRLVMLRVDEEVPATPGWGPLLLTFWDEWTMELTKTCFLNSFTAP